MTLTVVINTKYMFLTKSFTLHFWINTWFRITEMKGGKCRGLELDIWVLVLHPSDPFRTWESYFHLFWSGNNVNLSPWVLWSLNEIKFMKEIYDRHQTYDHQREILFIMSEFFLSCRSLYRVEIDTNNIPFQETFNTFLRRLFLSV